jgi:hypothetical protein
VFRIKGCKWEQVKWLPYRETPDHHLFPVHDAISRTSTHDISLSVQTQDESEIVDRIELWQDDQMKTFEQDTEATFGSRPESPQPAKLRISGLGEGDYRYGTSESSVNMRDVYTTFNKFGRVSNFHERCHPDGQPTERMYVSYSDQEPLRTLIRS